MSWFVAHKGWSSVFVVIALSFVAMWLGIFTSPAYLVAVLLAILVTYAILTKLGRDRGVSS